MLLSFASLHRSGEEKCVRLKNCQRKIWTANNKPTMFHLRIAYINQQYHLQMEVVPFNLKTFDYKI